MNLPRNVLLPAAQATKLPPLQDAAEQAPR